MIHDFDYIEKNLEKEFLDGRLSYADFKDAMSSLSELDDDDYRDNDEYEYYYG